MTHHETFRAVRCSSAIALGLALISTLRASAQTAAPREFPSDSVVLAIIKQRVAEKRSAAIVVGMVAANGATRIVAFGDPGPGHLPLDSNTVFEIGSVTKVFTSTLLAKMVLDGRVALSDPVQKFLPSTVHVPTRNGKQITLENLATQNSGLPRMPSNFVAADPANPYADYTVPLLYAFLSGYVLERDPGESFEYSNLGVGLLGHVLSLVSKTTYEQAEHDQVWVPLGMDHTMITLTPWGRQHLAAGHDAGGSVVANWDLQALAGAGAIRSTMADMLRFVSANLHTDRGPLGAAMALAQRSRSRASALNADIGLNWIKQSGADTITWHNGGTAGYRSFVGLAPSKGIGVVVLTNSGGEGADDIGLHLLSPTFPLKAAPVAKPQRTVVTLTSEVLQRYVGTYQLTPDVTIDVTLVADALYAKVTGQGALRIWPETETDFFYKEVDAQITFVRDAQTRTTGLVLHQNGRDTPAAKVK